MRYLIALVTLALVLWIYREFRTDWSKFPDPNIG